MRFAAVMLATLVACSHPERSEPKPAPDPVRARFEAAEAQLLAMTEPYGWVVSRWEDGSLAHTGDSLIWTGMALGVLSCGGGDAAESALLGMLNETGGKLYRHPSEANREASLDGHLGFYWGISERIKRCPDRAQIWADVLPNHKPDMPEAFDVVLGSLHHRLGIGPAPSSHSVSGLANVLAGWAALVVAKKAAAFRIHLGLLALETMDDPGTLFCAATPSAGMVTVDNFCGRPGLEEWIAGFEYDKWEMALQRASWESPDGKPGLSTPGLDLLVAMRAAYTF